VAEVRFPPSPSPGGSRKSGSLNDPTRMKYREPSRKRDRHEADDVMPWAGIEPATPALGEPRSIH
jgi:hypothetical protein